MPRVFLGQDVVVFVNSPMLKEKEKWFDLENLFGVHPPKRFSMSEIPTNCI